MNDTTYPTTESTTRQRLSRPRNGRVLAGVAAAFGELTGIATGFIRLAFLALTLLGGFGLLAYAVAWILLPSSDETKSPAERWLNDLTTPGKRTGAALIAVAALIVLAPFAPFAVIAAGVLLVAGIYLTRSGNEN